MIQQQATLFSEEYIADVSVDLVNEILPLKVNYNFTIFCSKSLLLKYFVLFFCIYFIVDYGLKQV